MPSSSRDHVTRPLHPQERITSPLPQQLPVGNTPTPDTDSLSAPTSGPLAESTPPTTGPLAYTPIVTRPLTTLPAFSPNATTTTRLPTIIPATEKRPSVRSREKMTPPLRRRRRTTLLSAILSSLVVVIILTFFIAPVDNGQERSGIAQTLDSFITKGSAFNALIPQQLATPTATPSLMTGEGYCGGTDIWGTCATAVTASGVMGTGTMQKPIQGAIITQPFAHPEYQTWCGCIRPHSGIDLAAPYGTPITAADSGQVIWVGWDWSGLGWAVKINHGHYIATIYGHLDHFIVKVGQNVTQGQIIGYEGSTGASTGPHLHFMVMVNNIWVDPTLYVALP
jgi:murein DD-endopeptidase MepM/ murein hydrolase activator NlpD